MPKRLLKSIFTMQASKYFLLGLVFLLSVPSFVFGAISQNISISVSSTIPVNHCSDGIKNFDETGVDCGGAMCSACGGGGGGGGGGLPILISSVTFSGTAYPNAKIFLLRDGVLLGSFLASSSGTFAYALSSVSAGNYRYTFYAQDARGGYSTSLVFPLTVTAGNSYHISNILMPPTLYFNSQEIKRGDTLELYGQSAPNSILIFELKNSILGTITTFQINVDFTGNYTYLLETLGLLEGSYEIKAKTKIGAIESIFSNSFAFTVGTKTVEKPTPESRCPAKGDLNGDCRVNLVDFSIAAYWYKRTVATSFLGIEDRQLNGDEIINLVDFSILAYYWTG